ncbi:MAG: hypothetical protein LBE62_00875, partial [Azonexus sp.]|nr:hypothetical protein [Azonexus sp.]
AKEARRQHDPKLALDIMRAFDKNHPGHPLIPDVYFLSASILCEDLRRDDMADRIFAAIVKRYPEHACAAQAGKYRETLARLKGQSQDGT